MQACPGVGRPRETGALVCSLGGQGGVSGWGPLRSGWDRGRMEDSGTGFEECPPERGCWEHEGQRPLGDRAGTLLPSLACPPGQPAAPLPPELHPWFARVAPAVRRLGFWEHSDPVAPGSPRAQRFTSCGGRTPSWVNVDLCRGGVRGLVRCPLVPGLGVQGATQDAREGGAPAPCLPLDPVGRGSPADPFPRLSPESRRALASAVA